MLIDRNADDGRCTSYISNRCTSISSGLDVTQYYMTLYQLEVQTHDFVWVLHQRPTVTKGIVYLRDPA